MNGDLYAYGADDAGQFGNGTTNPTSTNTPVFIRHNVAKVSDGHEFSLILDNSGNLYAAGDNSQGEFCNATFSNSSTYTLVKSNVTDMSAGYRDEQYGSAQWTVFVTTAGNAYTCGSGPLGNGSSNQYQIDTAKLVGTGYSDVYAMDGSNWGGEGTFLLSSNGDAYSTGGMTGSLIAASSPTLSDTAFAFVRGNVKLISGQGGLVYLLDASGSAVGSCGINGVGALGDGTTACSGTPKTVSTNVKFVAAAENNSFFIKSDGTLWATGQNEGVFGNGSVAPTTTPVRVTLP
jgi:alpha-tubulin suppressor-like RCC1 family protein